MTTPRIGHIFRLAQIIKESCEQCTDQEATSLAKAILEHPGSHWSTSARIQISLSGALGQTRPADCI